MKKLNVKATVAELQRLTVGQLRQRYLEVFSEPARSGNRQHLIKRIVWRIQALREGDLSERARRRAEELARDADLRLTPPRINGEGDGPVVQSTIRIDAGLPSPGTLIRRVYKGRAILVKVLPKGFEYEGEIYRSLSAVAKKVTGSHWNGRLFFRLVKENR